MYPKSLMLEWISRSKQSNIELTSRIVATKRIEKGIRKVYGRNFERHDKGIFKIIQRIVHDCIVDDIYMMVEDMIENGAVIPYFTDEVLISIKNRNVESISYKFDPKTNGDDYILFVQISHELQRKIKEIYVGKFTKDYKYMLKNAVIRGKKYPYHKMKIYKSK